MTLWLRRAGRAVLWAWLAAIVILWAAWTGSALVTMSVADGVIAAIMSSGCCFGTFAVGAVAVSVFFSAIISTLETRTNAAYTGTDDSAGGRP